MCRISKIYNDFGKLCLIVFLYMLQGLQSGLSAALALILQSDSKAADNTLQTIFSLTSWPYALRFLWVPLVDAIYSCRIGRRRSWLIPIQMSMGIVFIVLALHIDWWLGRAAGTHWGPIGTHHSVQIASLTLSWLLLTILTSTQESIVDGFSISILSSENLAMAATCNSLGQSIGYVIGYLSFLVLESPEVCNIYLRIVSISDQGFISFSGFLFFWGIVIIMSTSILALFKLDSDKLRVNDDKQTSLEKLKAANPCLVNGGQCKYPVRGGSEKPQQTPKSLPLLEAYANMLKILRLRNVQLYTLWLFSTALVFSAPDRLFPLKLIDIGLSKSRLALLTVSTLPVQLIVPPLVSRWSNGPTPIGTALLVAAPRALTGLLTVAFIHLLCETRRHSEMPTGQLITYFAPVLDIGVFIYFGVISFLSNTMCVSQMAFNARISDPVIGATYMTLLNTLGNLSIRVSDTLVLFFMEQLSTKQCSRITRSNSSFFLEPGNKCNSPAEIKECLSIGGACIATADGFNLEIISSFVLAAILLMCLLPSVAKRLDSSQSSEFQLYQKR